MAYTLEWKTDKVKRNEMRDAMARKREIQEKKREINTNNMSRHKPKPKGIYMCGAHTLGALVNWIYTAGKKVNTLKHTTKKE